MLSVGALAAILLGGFRQASEAFGRRAGPDFFGTSVGNPTFLRGGGLLVAGSTVQVKHHVVAGAISALFVPLG